MARDGWYCSVMEFKIETSEDNLVVTIRGEKRKSAVIHLLATGVFVTAIHFFIYQSIVRLLAEFAGVSWALFTISRQQFSVSVFTITKNCVYLSRHVFGVGRIRRFFRSDVERLGYEPEAGQDDAALALMVRTVMMPLRFAHGISPSEAEQIFSSVKSSGCWIGNEIRSVGIAIF
jgi:hypothetical protein